MIAQLWRHELRWARTIRTLEPPRSPPRSCNTRFFLALLTLFAAGLALWAWLLTLAAWAVRALAATGIDRALGRPPGGLAFGCPVWLLPIRDLLSATEWIVSPCRTPGRLARTDARGRHAASLHPGITRTMMKTLFLQPLHFDGFDGGAGSRYQARREIKSFWFPTWLAQPAALVGVAG